MKQTILHGLASLAIVCVVTLLLVLGLRIGSSTAENAATAPSLTTHTDESRSIALFLDAARVIESPRCMNCHPATRSPTQGQDMHPHVPPLQAGMDGHGVAGLACSTCHQRANVATFGAAIASIPGHPHWALAPASMSWQGKTPAEICKQLKNPALNGGRTLAEIQEHVAKDSLVGWAWHPGAGRAPAPGTQEEFGKLIGDWIATGAACPEG